MQLVFTIAIPGSQHDASCVPACSSKLKNTQHVCNAFRHRRRKFREVGYMRTQYGMAGETVITHTYMSSFTDISTRPLKQTDHRAVFLLPMLLPVVTIARITDGDRLSYSISVAHKSAGHLRMWNFQCYLMVVQYQVRSGGAEWLLFRELFNLFILCV
jgi:hypothetical protein